MKQVFLFKSTSRNINVTPESNKKILKSIRKKTLISYKEQQIDNRLLIINNRISSEFREKVVNLVILHYIIKVKTKIEIFIEKKRLSFTFTQSKGEGEGGIIIYQIMLNRKKKTEARVTQ